MRFVLIALALASACAPKLPADEGRYQECMTRVELDMHAKANRLCPPDEVYFDDCEHAPAITEELEVLQEQCNE